MKEIRTIITTIKALSKREGTWKLVAALLLWVVIIIVFAVVILGKDNQIWKRLPKFNGGQVAGEKTVQNEVTDSAQATVTSSPEATSTPKATGQPPRTTEEIINVPVRKNNPETVHKPAEPPDLLDYFGDKLANLKALEGEQRLNLRHGNMKFSFTL